jgi:hypothetical protein
MYTFVVGLHFHYDVISLKTSSSAILCLLSRTVYWSDTNCCLVVEGLKWLCIIHVLIRSGCAINGIIYHAK